MCMRALLLAQLNDREAAVAVRGRSAADLPPGICLGCVQGMADVCQVRCAVPPGEIGEHEAACPRPRRGRDGVQRATFRPALGHGLPAGFGMPRPCRRVKVQGPGSCQVQGGITCAGVCPVEHAGDLGAVVDQDVQRMQVKVQELPRAAVSNGSGRQPRGSGHRGQPGMNSAAGPADSPRQSGPSRSRGADELGGLNRLTTCCQARTST